jgi:hypothetical protein
MSFNLKDFLSKLQGKEKRDIEKYMEDNDESQEELINEDEEEFFDTEEESEYEEPNEKKSKTGQESSKLKINLKNKKIKFSIAAISVLIIGAAITPYVMSYIGQKEADNIGNISNIAPATPSPKEVVKPNRPNYRHGNSIHNNVSVHKKVHKSVKSDKYGVRNIHNTHNTVGMKTQRKIEKPIQNIVINNETASLVSVKNKHENSLNNIKVEQIKNDIKKTNQQIKKIQQHLIESKLTGQNDPVGLIDKTIMKNRNYDLYLQSQIRLMKKLVTYYKQRTELQKTLKLYKMAFLGDDETNGYSSKNIKHRTDNTEQLQKALKSVVMPLERQIAVLKKQLEKAKRQEALQNIKEREEFSFVGIKKSLNLNDLNIFAKNGKYIAVIHTSVGDKIYKEGDYFNGYKIQQILPNLIIFERNGQKFYYSYNQNLNQEYQTAEITLPAKITKNGVKENKNNKKNQVKEYTPVSRQQLIQRLLQQRLKQMGK